MSAADLFAEVAQRLVVRDRDHPLRVGIDGPCGSGKTTFRRGLAEFLRRAGTPVVELDSDGFHHPRRIRYRQGRDSARGYYEDAYDFASIERRVLAPLGTGGDRRIATKVHDLASDEVTIDHAVVARDAIVLLDCTFLQRGGLRSFWDEVVYLDVDLGVARARGIDRDADALGGRVTAAEAYDRRYLAAWALYEAEVRPASLASLVVDNTDLEHPRLR